VGVRSKEQGGGWVGAELVRISYLVSRISVVEAGVGGIFLE